MSSPGFPRPLPDVSGEAGRYWQAIGEGRIELPRCQSCEQWIFPPRPFCPKCHSLEVSWEEVSGTGRVYTFSIVHRATHPWFLDKTPYVYALVELEIGVRLPTAIVGCAPADVAIGLAVEPVFESAADEITLLCFRPVRS